MKILIISNGSNFSGAGGMEYHIVDIADWLQRNGVDTALAVRRDTFLHRELLRGKPNVYPLTWTGINKIFSLFELAMVIYKFSPDIISINRERDIMRSFVVSKLLGLFTRKRPKIVSVFHTVGWNGWISLLNRLDGLIFPNKYTMQEYFPKIKKASVPSTVIYHGITLPEVDLSKKYNVDRKNIFFKTKGFPIIGMIGELRKNQSELIDVARHLQKLTPRFTMAIVGRGSDDAMNQLKTKIEQYGLTEHFVITGGIERKLITDVFYDLDISVTTFRADAFGIAYIESLASYTPLVAYNSGGPVEILEKGGGILVEDGPLEMAEAIYALIADHSARKALGLAGRAAAEKYFSIDAMGEQHLNFYRKILSGIEETK